MERAIQKLAQQLNQYDESSLMELWGKYADKVAHFEPSARWEESALAFCMIQAVHWKNQLFNAELAASARRGKTPEDKELKAGLASFPKAHADAKKQKTAAPGSPEAAGNSASKSVADDKKSCKVLVFRPADAGKP